MASKKIYKFTGFDKVIFNGVELNQVPPTLEDCRWDEIQAMARNGTIGNYYNVGAKKDIVLSSGEKIEMKLVSINTAGDYQPYYPNNTIDFVSTNTANNASNLCRWMSKPYQRIAFPNSDLCHKLNNEIFYRLPVELQNIIIEKRKSYYFYSSDSIVSGVIGESKLWLPTAGECGASSNYEPKPYYKDYGLYNSFYPNTRCTSISGPNVEAQNLNAYYEDNDKLLPPLICFRIG